jgi:hypothetical protein
MSNIVDLNSRRDPGEPMDDVTVCTISVTGKGDVSLWLNDYIETPEQFNWLITKVVAAASGINATKTEIIANS